VPACVAVESCLGKVHYVGGQPTCCALELGPSSVFVQDVSGVLRDKGFCARRVFTEDESGGENQRAAKQCSSDVCGSGDFGAVDDW
jgi:hypothetical protein